MEVAAIEVNLEEVTGSGPVESEGRGTGVGVQRRRTQ